MLISQRSSLTAALAAAQQRLPHCTMLTLVRAKDNLVRTIVVIPCFVFELGLSLHYIFVLAAARTMMPVGC